jgi:hypothetical protein
MGFGRSFTIIACIWATFGHCDDSLWLIEQDFVKFGKKEAYESFKKTQEANFVKKVGYPRVCIENSDASEYLYLIPVGDFSGLNSLMRKRMDFHKMLTKDEAEKQKILPFLTTVNFFIESVHRYLPEASFIPVGKESILTYPAVHYSVYGIVSGNGPNFEDRLKQIAVSQRASTRPICFRSWRVIFGGDVPSYIVAVFGDSPKEARHLADSFKLTEGQTKNIIRQEKSGSGVIRQDLSSVAGNL